MQKGDLYVSLEVFQKSKISKKAVSERLILLKTFKKM